MSRSGCRWSGGGTSAEFQWNKPEIWISNCILISSVCRHHAEPAYSAAKFPLCALLCPVRSPPKCRFCLQQQFLLCCRLQCLYDLSFSRVYCVARSCRFSPLPLLPPYAILLCWGGSGSVVSRPLNTADIRTSVFVCVLLYGACICIMHMCIPSFCFPSLVSGERRIEMSASVCR